MLSILVYGVRIYGLNINYSMQHMLPSACHTLLSNIPLLKIRALKSNELLKNSVNKSVLKTR